MKHTKAQTNDILNITEELTTQIVILGDCCICNTEARTYHNNTNDETKTKKLTAEDLYNDGWRVRTVHEHQTRGLICPTCITKIDR